jgi:putative transposase
MMIGRAAETRVPGHDEHIHVVADAAARYLIRDRDGKFPQLFDAVLDRTLIWDQRHLLHALREFETFYNGHRPHQGIANARPLHPLPDPIENPLQIDHLDIRRRARLGGILHEYQHAA